MPANKQNQALIQQLIRDHPDGQNADLAADLIETALRLLDDQADRLDMKLMTAALKELRYSARVFSPYRERRKVTIFGSARTKSAAPEYLQAVAFSKAIVDRGFMVITGGGEGIMGAGQRGAGRENSFGLNIRLPFEQEPNDEIAGDPKLINFKYFFTRKLCFMKESSAIALFPGGFGTLDEVFETATLIQTGKIRDFPIVLMGTEFWAPLMDFMSRTLLADGKIRQADLDRLTLTDSAEDAVALIRDAATGRFGLRYAPRRPRRRRWLLE